MSTDQPAAQSETSQLAKANARENSLQSETRSMHAQIQRLKGEVDTLQRMEAATLKDYQSERKAREEAERNINELNDVLRAAGWGQGEIDSCSESIYKAESRAEAAEQREIAWKDKYVSATEACDAALERESLAVALAAEEAAKVCGDAPYGNGEFDWTPKDCAEAIRALSAPAISAEARRVASELTRDAFIRAFVAGARHERYSMTGFTQFPAERDIAEAEAAKIFDTIAAEEKA